MTIEDNTSVIDTLRASRGAQNALEKVLSHSVEARTKKIAEALAGSWEFGPAELKATYGSTHYAIAKDSNGRTFRVKVEETEDSIKLGKVEILSIDKPATDLVGEMFETAQSAAHAILNDKFDSAGPMISSIARALDTKGELHRKLNLEASLKGLSRRSWYQDLIDQNNIEVEGLALPNFNDESTAEEYDDAVHDLLTKISECLTRTRRVIEQSGDNLGSTLKAMANAIVEDARHAVSALKSTKDAELTETARVFETVFENTDKLLVGTELLVRLAVSRHEDKSSAENGTSGEHKEMS